MLRRLLNPIVILGAAVIEIAYQLAPFGRDNYVKAPLSPGSTRAHCDAGRADDGYLFGVPEDDRTDP